jgi:hypothetical protein
VVKACDMQFSRLDDCGCSRRWKRCIHYGDISLEIGCKNISLVKVLDTEVSRKLITTPTIQLLRELSLHSSFILSPSECLPLKMLLNMSSLAKRPRPRPRPRPRLLSNTLHPLGTQLTCVCISSYALGYCSCLSKTQVFQMIRYFQTSKISYHELVLTSRL